MARPKSSRRFTARRAGNKVWINGYNAVSIPPRVVGTTLENQITNLLVPTDWAQGKDQSCSLLAMHYWLHVIAVDVDEQLPEARVPYQIFITDESFELTHASLVGNYTSSALWPVWAEQNPRILHFGTVQYCQCTGSGDHLGTSQFETYNGWPENIVSLRPRRRLQQDESLRICLPPQPLMAYPGQIASYWQMEMYSRFLLKLS